MQKTGLKISVIACASLFCFVMLRYIVVVQRIDCVVVDQPASCPDAVLQELDTLKGQPLLFSALPELIESSLRTQPFTLSAFARQLPDTAVVELASTEYEFGIQSDNRFFLVTTSGLVLEKPSDADIPTIHVSNSLISPNAPPSIALVQLCETVLSTLATLNINHSNVTYASPQAINIELQPSKIIAIVDPARAQEQLRMIPVILGSSQLQQVTEPITELDLRFDLPVIRTKSAATP